MLNKIEITDYYYKDKVGNGNILQKKVIGQQVAEILPNAVSKNNKEVIPDIMKIGKISDQWVELPEHSLKKGDKVKLIFDESTEELLVLESVDTKFKVASKNNGNVFVYGREVDDFHIVDYDAISMLNVSATQELSKQIDILKAQYKTLEEENTILRSKLESLESSVASIIEHLNVSSKNSLVNEK